MFEVETRPRQQGNFTLDMDPRKGLEAAIRNGQTRLALEYAQEVIDGLIRYTEGLEARLESLESTPKPRPATGTKKATVNDAAE